MGKSAVLARLVAVCAVTVLAGGALVVAPANADTPAPASALSVATPDTSVVRGNVVTTRGEVVLTGLRIRIAGVSSGGRASVTVTGPKQRSRAARVGKRYSKVIHRSTTLRVVPGVYRVTSRSVAATGGTDVPKKATKTLRVRKNRLTGFTVRYHFVASGLVSCATGGGAAGTCALGATGPGGGKVFYVNETNPTGSRYMEAAPNTWSGGSADPGIAWCDLTSTSIGGTFGTAIGTGKVNTDNMVATGACTSGAAISVRAYTGGSVTWSLPSQDELNALYTQKVTVGGFAADIYWSSSQDSANLAWVQNFGSGYQSYGFKVDAFHVRPVRAF